MIYLHNLSYFWLVCKHVYVFDINIFLYICVQYDTSIPLCMKLCISVCIYRRSRHGVVGLSSV